MPDHLQVFQISQHTNFPMILCIYVFVPVLKRPKDQEVMLPYRDVEGIILRDFPVDYRMDLH